MTRPLVRALPLRKSHAGFYTTLDGKYALVRAAKEGTLRAYEWVVLDNDYIGPEEDEEARPLPFGLMEVTRFKSLSEAAWMLREHGDRIWREDNGYAEVY